MDRSNTRDNEKAASWLESEEPDKYRIALLSAHKAKRTVRFYSLPLAVSMIQGLSSGGKMLYAKLNFDAWRSNHCRTGTGSLAASLAADRVTIRRWRRDLEKRGLIKIVHERGRCCYYLARKYRAGPSIPLLSEIVERRDVGRTEQLHLCWLSYRQGANDCSWEFQKQIAADLGCSMRTTRRVLRALKSRCEVQIRLRHWNRKKGNKYTLTQRAVKGGRIFGDNSHRTVRTHLHKKRHARGSLDASRQRILRRDLYQRQTKAEIWMEETLLELQSIGVNEKVAWLMAFEQRIPFENVVNAGNNGRILRADGWQRARQAGRSPPYFNLAGYVVAALNGASDQGKIITTTKLFREAGHMYQKHRKLKRGGTQRKTLSQKAFNKRKRKLLRQLQISA